MPDALRALRRGLIRADGFRLFVAVCNSPEQRDRWIAELARSLPDRAVNTVRLRSDTTQVLSAVLEQTSSLPPRPIMVVGLESLVDSSVKWHPVLAALNLGRSLWSQRLHAPIVLWIPEYVLSALGVEAPDFLDWRSDTVFLPELPEPTTRLPVTDTWHPGTDPDLTFDARRERIVELESRLKQFAHRADPLACQARAEWLHELGKHFYWLGELARARAAFEDELTLLASKGGSVPTSGSDARNRSEMDLHVASALHSLAEVLHAQGDLEGARQRLERSLEIKAAVFGTEEHSDIAVALHALAVVLRGQGDLAGARQLLVRALEIEAAVFGTEEHPSVAAALHELAVVLRGQGDLTGARQMLERSLEIKAAIFGTEEHSSVASSLHMLAGVLHDQGDWAGARRKLERVLEIEARLYGGHDHYSTAITESDLAMLLIRTGERERGLPMLSHALSVFQKQLGPQHPLTKQANSILEQLQGK